jgi:hypothetical protein
MLDEHYLIRCLLARGREDKDLRSQAENVFAAT